MPITRQSSLSVLQTLLNASLWEARFNPDLTVDFGKQVGSQTPVYNFAEGSTLMVGDDSFGISGLVDRVVLCGAGSVNANGVVGAVQSTNGDNRINVSVDNATSQNLYGTVEQDLQFREYLRQESSANLRASSEADLAQPLETTQIQVYDPNIGVKFFVGDYISLTSPTNGWINTSFRIMKKTVHFDSQGHEQVALNVAPTARMISFTHTRRKALEFILNSQTQNNSAALNSINETPNVFSQLLPNTVGQTLTIAVPSSGVTGHLHMTASITGIYNGAQFILNSFTESTSAKITSYGLVDTDYRGNDHPDD